MTLFFFFSLLLADRVESNSSLGMPDFVSCACLRNRGSVRVQTRAHKTIASRHRFIQPSHHTACSTTPMQVPAEVLRESRVLLRFGTACRTDVTDPCFHSVCQKKYKFSLLKNVRAKRAKVSADLVNAFGDTCKTLLVTFSHEFDFEFSLCMGFIAVKL